MTPDRETLAAAVRSALGCMQAEFRLGSYCVRHPGHGRWPCDTAYRIADASLAGPLAPPSGVAEAAERVRGFLDTERRDDIAYVASYEPDFSVHTLRATDLRLLLAALGHRG